MAHRLSDHINSVALALSLLENILHGLIYSTVELIKKSLVKKVSFIIIAKYFLVWLVGFTFKMMYARWLFSRAVESEPLAGRFVLKWAEALQCFAFSHAFFSQVEEYQHILVDRIGFGNLAFTARYPFPL